MRYGDTFAIRGYGTDKFLVLQDGTGDKLVEGGVNLITSVGSSEAGVYLSSHRKFATDKAWSWGRVPPSLTGLVRFEPQGGDLYEMVLDKKLPALAVKGNRPDGNYATSDLYLKHKENDWWKAMGRVDDTVVHVSGEKTHACESPCSTLDQVAALELTVRLSISI